MNQLPIDQFRAARLRKKRQSRWWREHIPLAYAVLTGIFALLYFMVAFVFRSAPIAAKVGCHCVGHQSAIGHRNLGFQAQQGVGNELGFCLRPVRGQWGSQPSQGFWFHIIWAVCAFTRDLACEKSPFRTQSTAGSKSNSASRVHCELVPLHLFLFFRHRSPS